MAGEAFQNTFRVLTKRIDQFGVAQPNINPDAKKGTISVELAGVKDDPERVRKILQATANLQFWEVYRGSELSASLKQAEDLLRKSKSETSDSAKVHETKTEDTSAAAATAHVDTTKTLSLNEIAKTDTGAKTNATTTAQTPTNTIIGLLMQAQQGDAALAYVQVKDTALLNQNLEHVKDIFPSDAKFLYGIAPKTKQGGLILYPCMQ